MQNNYSNREIRKTKTQNNYNSSSEENDHYRKNHLKSTKSNESKADQSPKKRKKADIANGEENGRNNENAEDCLYDNPIKRKRRKHKYRIDPLSVPRPNVFDELYRNDSKEYIFLTDEIPKANIPHSNSFFITNETENANIRFLRPTLHTLPLNYKFCTDTGLLFGFYMQPFAELIENEYNMETSQGSPIQVNIPVVEATSDKKIFKCKKCQAFINNKFEIKDEEYPKKTFICNICLAKMELKQNDEGVKDEYFYPDLSNLDELYCPVVDFKIFDPLELHKMKSPQFENTVYHLFMVDISNLAMSLNFSQYVINSILSNMQQIAKNSEEARNIAKVQMEMQKAQAHKQKQKQEYNNFNNSNTNNFNYNNEASNLQNTNTNDTYNYDSSHQNNVNLNSDFILNEKEIKFAIGLFNENTIYFAYLDLKTSELKFSAIRDLNEPFSPVAHSALFISYNQLLNQTFLETLTEKLTNFSLTRNSINSLVNQSKNSGTAFSASLYAGSDAFPFPSETAPKKIFNHMHVFVCNKNAGGAGFFPESDYIKKYSSENEIKLFLPESGTSVPLLGKILSRDVTLNCFVCGFTQGTHLEMQVNLPTFFDVSDKSGGRGFYYNLVNKPERFNEDIRLNYQKLHYDLSAVLNKKTYYNVQITMKHSSEFLISDVFYTVGNSVNSIYNSSSSGLANIASLGSSLLSNISSGISNININKDSNPNISNNFNYNFANEKGVIYLPSVNTDFNLLYNFTFSKTLKEERKYSFQFIVSYIDPEDDNARKIRVFNYGIFPNEIYFKVYSYIDNDAMVKLILAKEIADSLTEKNKNVCCFEKVKENLKKRLIDALFFYKKNCSSSASYDQLTLPSALRYFPLYIDSIFKKPLMRKIKNNIHPNTIYNFIYEIFTLPLKYTSKILYPRIYRIDNIIKNKTRCPEDYYYTKQNVGLQHEDLPIIIKPFIYALSLDSLEFNCAFLLDDGLVLSIIVFTKVNQMFVYENFGFDDFAQLERIYNENPDFNVDRYFQGQNEMEINVRITNLINQIRKDNSSYYQPIRLILINENNCLNEEFLSLFVEDEYKEEIPYIDFLCNIHNLIVEKLKLDDEDDDE